MMSVASAVEGAVGRLCDAGFPRDEARRDVVVLARGILKWSLADWLVRSGAEAPETFQPTLAALVDRRSLREPVAYLLGEKEFYGRPFRVTRHTLIPRPETEGLVDAALGWLAARRAPQRGGEGGSRPMRMVDVGTGTGCIAISIALESRDPANTAVVATDTSAEALAVARANAVELGATAVDFRLGHLLAQAPAPVDLIVSNPPYVAERDRSTLAADVERYEPATALFAGEDGLDVIRELIQTARRTLEPQGALMMEIGAGQADGVAALCDAAGFTAVQRHPDLQGIDRVIVAHMPGASL